MKLHLTCLAVMLLAAPLATTPVQACGFGETPGDCSEGGGSSAAQWMLRRVVSAMEADKAKALGQFTRGEGGFRTADMYVFCVGEDGIMAAHPNPILQGQDVRELHDQTGNYFIQAMLKSAEAGAVQEIRYLFPRPGGTTAVPKTTYYTKAGDQVCGVGFYEGDETAAAPSTPVTRVAQLRQKLDGAMPANLRSDWTAFLEALNTESSGRNAVFAKARESLQAAQAALGEAPVR